MPARPSSLDWIRLLARLPLVVRGLLLGWRAGRPSSRYRPERHYMRGPGPKSLAKAGRD